MKNEELTNPVQIVSVVKHDKGYLSILKGTGGDITHSLVSAIEGTFRAILESDKIKNKVKAMVQLWCDLAFDPLHSILEDEDTHVEDALTVARAMAIIVTKMHSYSSEEIEEEIDNDEYSDDSSTD